jgi:hypothetical protein
LLNQQSFGGSIQDHCCSLSGCWQWFQPRGIRALSPIFAESVSAFCRILF